MGYFGLEQDWNRWRLMIKESFYFKLVFGQNLAQSCNEEEADQYWRYNAVLFNFFENYLHHFHAALLVIDYAFYHWGALFAGRCHIAVHSSEVHEACLHLIWLFLRVCWDLSICLVSNIPHKSKNYHYHEADKSGRFWKGLMSLVRIKMFRYCWCSAYAWLWEIT